MGLPRGDRLKVLQFDGVQVLTAHLETHVVDITSKRTMWSRAGIFLRKRKGVWGENQFKIPMDA